MDDELKKDNRRVFMVGTVAITLIAAVITKWTFYASLGPLMADFWAFAAGIFLVSEGIWRISLSQEKSVFIQWCRLLRISGGVSLLIIHTLQFLRDGRLGI